MKVLVACEESQTVCKAFRERGHEAYSCDIIEPSGGHPEWHIHGDALKAIDAQSVKTMDGVTHWIGRWDLLIAHPPCTYLSKSGACRLYKKAGVIDDERYRKGIEAKAFFLSLLAADIPRIAVENPVQLTVFRMPKYTQEIQPYQFGDPYTKKTRLWLRNLPTLKATDIVTPVAPWLPSCTGRKNREAYGAAPRGNARQTKQQRAKTFPGIARAMADQWGGLA